MLAMTLELLGCARHADLLPLTAGAVPALRVQGQVTSAKPPRQGADGPHPGKFPATDKILCHLVLQHARRVAARRDIRGRKGGSVPPRVASCRMGTPTGPRLRAALAGIPTYAPGRPAA